jgi:phosphate:Na+ symporter
MYLLMISSLLGGVGIFILGMILITEGLKSLAGDTLRGILSRFTGGRVSSILSGAGITTAFQSSHATVIMTIGFVSAGLLSLQQSLGVILGAHLGTTSTGWLVSLLGLKLKIGTAMLPLIGLGAILRLIGRDRIANAGIVIAGFGLIFVGIDVLQDAMKVLSGYIDLSRFSGAGIVNRLVLVGMGIAMTVVMQASSAAVAITMTALNAGTIDFTQAAALVIGQNIGTTLTAAIVAIGATSPAKRTAVAHIVFNVITGIVAFVILPYFVLFINSTARFFGVMDRTITLAGFHTAFNLLGILLIAPFLGFFSVAFTRFIPDRGPYLTRHLDSSLANLPPVAVEAARRVIIDITIMSIDIVREMIVSEKISQLSKTRLGEVGDALHETRRFLGKIKALKGTSQEFSNRFIGIMHAIDHVDQLIIACWEFEKLSSVQYDRQLNHLAQTLAENVETVLVRLEGLKKKESLQEMENTSLYMKEIRERQREEILGRTAAGAIDADTAMRQIEAVRWLDRVTYRIFRSLYYLGYHSGNSELNDTIDSGY